MPPVKEDNLSVFPEGYLTYSDWEKVQAHEAKEGASLGKCREKVTDRDEMLRIARN